MKTMYEPQPIRECGDCTLCCKLMAIEDTPSGLDTPMGETCKHVCERGCAIYKTRPEPCRTWVCLWLQGMFPDDQKPNTIGVTVHLAKLRTSYFRMCWIVTEDEGCTAPQNIIDTLPETPFEGVLIPILVGPADPSPKRKVRVLWPRLEDWKNETTEAVSVGADPIW